MIDCLNKYAGQAQRSGDLFSNKNFVAKAMNFSKMLKGVPNVFTQHQSLVSLMLENIAKNKLNRNEFPSTTNFNSKEKITEAIIFIVGGCTYEEAKEIALDKNANFILGGTYIHNSKR